MRSFYSYHRQKTVQREANEGRLQTKHQLNTASHVLVVGINKTEAFLEKMFAYIIHWFSNQLDKGNRAFGGKQHHVKTQKAAKLFIFSSSSEMCYLACAAALAPCL